MQDITDAVGFKDNVFGSDFGNDSFEIFVHSFPFLLFRLSSISYFLYPRSENRLSQIQYIQNNLCLSVDIFKIKYYNHL